MREKCTLKKLLRINLLAQLAALSVNTHILRCIRDFIDVESAIMISATCVSPRTQVYSAKRSKQANTSMNLRRVLKTKTRLTGCVTGMRKAVKVK